MRFLHTALFLFFGSSFFTVCRGVDAPNPWILRTIKVQGVYFGKDDYKRLYQQTVGDRFVSDRHAVSVEALQSFLHDAGYKKGAVVAHVEHEDTTHTVTVTLTVNKGSIFSVSAVACLVSDKRGIVIPEHAQALKEKVITLLHKKKATVKNYEKARKAIKKWLLEKNYHDSDIEITEVVVGDRVVDVAVTITVGYLKKNIFLGNSYFSSSELQKKVMDIPSAAAFIPSSITAQELEHEYKHKGFWDVNIETVSDGVGTDYFIITEGQRSSLKKIQFKGVQAADAAFLKKRFFSKVLHTKFFDQNLLDQALHDCIGWYKSEGFWDAKILKKEYLSLEKNALHHQLVLVIEEGTQRFLKQLAVEGMPVSYAAMPTLLALKATQQPIPFSAQAITEQRTFLMKQLREQGYLHPHLSYDLTEDSDGVVVTWNCRPGPQVHFGKTVVQGYTSVAEDRILKLLAYQEGQVWSKEKIQQSLTTLRGLGIFERVSLSPDFKDSALDQRKMILVVKDDEPFEIKVRVGFAQVSKNFHFKKGSTYKAGGSFIWKNPLHKADRFAVDVDYNKYEKKINASYKIPFLGLKQIDTIVKVYANKYVQPVYIGSNKPLYQVLQQGVLLGVNKKRNHCDVGLTGGFEWMETNDISLELARAINFDAKLVDKKIPYFFIEPMVYADFLNDPLNPTQGFFGMATIKGMFPFKESSFLIKFLGEQGIFIPFDPAVLAMRFRAGHIFRRSFRAVMPPERFFLGGPYSLRGYPQDYCPPLGAYQDGSEVSYVPQGGKTMMNANFELRMPFDKKTVWAAVFQDFGMLLEDVVVLGIGSSKPLAATGFGIRYMTPVGPLRFDIGWKWRKDRPDEPSYAWFLTFGNVF